MAPAPTEGRSGARLAGLLRAAAAPASWAYGRAIDRRNRRFDAGIGVRRVPLRVISVGNIVVGGTGKTPTVAWIARALRERGIRPMIALRGYGSGDPTRADEVLEYHEALGDVPVAAGADRFETITRALRDGARADVVLLDDGFQHRRLHRDLDLVLVDASRPALDDALLPCGRLREPATALRRADAVVVTRATSVDAALAAQVERLHGKPPLAWLRHAWRGIDVHEAAGRGPSSSSIASRAESVEWLRGRRVVTSLGVASPVGVRAMLEAAGAVLVTDVPARDHQPYDASRLRRLAAECRASHADALVVTRKDWVKLREAIMSCDNVLDLPVAVPRLEVEAISGEDALVKVVSHPLIADF